MEGRKLIHLKKFRDKNGTFETLETKKNFCNSLRTKIMFYHNNNNNNNNNTILYIINNINFLESFLVFINR